MSIKRYDVGMTTENNPHGFNHSFPWVYEAEQGKYVEYSDYARLEADVERLTKAVMHSPAAQFKLKELEGKTTFDEINPKDDNSNITTELLALSNRQASDIRRLTKAGDNLARVCRGIYGGLPLWEEWHTAKGVQS